MSLPSKMSLTTSGDELMITYRWFNWGSLALFGITSFLVTFALFFSELSTLETVINPLFWIVFGLGFASLISMHSKKVVRVNPQRLTIRQGRLFMLIGGKNSVVEAPDIDQVYVKENVQRSSKSTTTTYDVYVTDKQSHHQEILSGLETADQALFFEQEIERYLGLEDRAIPDEHQPTESYDFSGWISFAERNGLAYRPGKLPTHYRVSGDYQGYGVELEAVEPRLALTSRRTRLTLAASNPPAENQDSEPPLILKGVAALFAMPLKPGLSLKGKFKVGEQRGEFIYEQDGVETNEARLQAVFEMLYRVMAAYPNLIALGGEAIPVLQSIALDRKHPAQAVAAHLIEEIAPTTEHLDRPDQASLLCPHCLVRCASHEVKASWFNTITYFGCRHCHQSREFLNIDQVTAILDQQAGDTPVQDGQTLVVNWLSRQRMFDFDTIAIIDATDEAVERFAVQVGNDTDPVRQPRYQAMRCVITTDCQISTNTRRILQQTFDQVTVETFPTARRNKKISSANLIDTEQPPTQQASSGTDQC